MTGFVVEVNECKVLATRSGAEWWIAFRKRFDDIRITDVAVTLGGNVCHVAADSREDADWLVDCMAANGMPASALNVKRVAS